jgi:regulator of replication initiation timing
MEDLIETAIDRILVSAGGDMRQALRALLIENIKLQMELSRRDGTLSDQEAPRSRKAVLH